MITIKPNTVPIIVYGESDNKLNEYGSPSKGTTIEYTEKSRPALLWGGIDRHVFTDGHILINDKDIADKLLSYYSRKIAIKNLSHTLGENVSDEKINEAIKNIKKSLGDNFPKYEDMIPDKNKLGDKPLKIVGYGYSNGGNLAYLTDGDKIVVVDPDKLAFIYKNVPNSKLYMSDDKTNSPIAIVSEDKVKGVLMPISNPSAFGYEYIKKIVDDKKENKIEIKSKVKEIEDRINKPRMLGWLSSKTESGKVIHFQVKRRKYPKAQFKNGDLVKSIR